MEWYDHAMGIFGKTALVFSIALFMWALKGRW